MATRPNQEAIETFMSITGVTEPVAAQKLEEHGGDLNEAVNAHFCEGDRNIIHETTAAAPQSDFMDIDDPIPVEPLGPPLFLDAATNLNPFSPLDPSFKSSFDSSSPFMNPGPSITHPREVREIPIEVKDGNEPSGHSPTIEDVTGTAHAHGLDNHGTVIIDDEEDEGILAAPATQAIQQNEGDNNISASADSTPDRHLVPSAPEYNLPDNGNDIEEEMIRAAIEASKQDVGESYPNQHSVQNDFRGVQPQQRQSHLEDPELAHAVSLSLKTAEKEKALREKEGEFRESKVGNFEPALVDLEKIAAANGRLEPGSSSIKDEAKDVEEQPLVSHRSRHMSSGSVESGKAIEEVLVSPPSSPGRSEARNHLEHNGSAFPSEEWGGISSEEHDEAVMLEAAMFGGIPEGRAFNFPYAPHGPHQYVGTGVDPLRMPRPPSPSLEAQRLIREQQDDEYLASLQADREKELKAMEEAEARRLEEEAAREAALEEKRKKEEESRRKLEEEQESERQLAAKEASLPQEPASDDESAVTLLVRMPDGSRRGRRFIKSDKLQSLFDFIDVGRGVKPGTYRLVRPYPRRAFSDGESTLTLNELGLTSKQEALFLELI